MMKLMVQASRQSYSSLSACTINESQRNPCQIGLIGPAVICRVHLHGKRRYASETSVSMLMAQISDPISLQPEDQDPKQHLPSRNEHSFLSDLVGLEAAHDDDTVAAIAAALRTYKLMPLAGDRTLPAGAWHFY